MRKSRCNPEISLFKPIIKIIYRYLIIDINQSIHKYWSFIKNTDQINTSNNLHPYISKKYNNIFIIIIIYKWYNKYLNYIIINDVCKIKKRNTHTHDVYIKKNY